MVDQTDIEKLKAAGINVDDFLDSNQKLDVSSTTSDDIESGLGAFLLLSICAMVVTWLMV